MDKYINEHLNDDNEITPSPFHKYPFSIDQVFNWLVHDNTDVVFKFHPDVYTAYLHKKDDDIILEIVDEYESSSYQDYKWPIDEYKKTTIQELMRNNYFGNEPVYSLVVEEFDPRLWMYTQIETYNNSVKQEIKNIYHQKPRDGNIGNFIGEDHPPEIHDKFYLKYTVNFQRNKLAQAAGPLVFSSLIF